MAPTIPDERSGSMKRSQFTEEQTVYALRQAESGTPISDLCRQLGIAEQTFSA
jgi:putative transposase